MALRHYFREKNSPTVWSGSNVNKNMVIVQLWGAGGGGATPGGWSFGAEGGGGGYVYAEIPIVQLIGKDLILVVGEGGLVNGSRVSYGGGGQANRTGSDNRYGSNGGGYTGLFLDSVSQQNAIAIAGGGGGGGSSRAGSGNVGGAGGGNEGQDGVSPYDGKTAYRGRGGTQTAGGSQASSDSFNTDFPPAALVGGTARVNGYGGAGGGGYWGGSAGGYSESNTMGGGGGGSGYLNPSYTINGRNIRGNLKTPAGITESGFLGTSIAYGGDVSSAGRNGFARITINGVTREYSYTGSDIRIPILSSNASLIPSGLVLNLDAGNVASYPGSGTTWTDLIGSGNNGTLVGGPTYNSANGGSIVFDASDDYVNLGSFFTYQNFTISLWVYPGTTQNQYADIFDNSHTGFRSFVLQQDNLNTNVYAFGANDSSGGISGTSAITLTPNVWTNLAFTFTPSDRVIGYVNGAFNSQGALAGGRNITYSEQSLSIARWSLGGRHWNGRVATFSAYNRVLSASEIAQNFNALRSRFGI
jgi:hypothetical protein